MFFELKDGNQTVFTHSSLVDEKKQEQIQNIYDKLPFWQNGARFISFWGCMEAVNRVHALKKLPFAYKVGIVAVPTLIGGFVGEFAFWNFTSNWNQVKNLLEGAPVYEKRVDVPELNKLFFFLDDDNKYLPSLNHHAVTKARTFLKMYKPTM